MLTASLRHQTKTVRVVPGLEQLSVQRRSHARWQLVGTSSEGDWSVLTYRRARAEVPFNQIIVALIALSAVLFVLGLQEASMRDAAQRQAPTPGISQPFGPETHSIK